MKPLFSLLATAALWLTSMAHAAMEVDRNIVTFQAGSAPREDVTVFNRGEEPLFAEIEVLDVRNPGTDEEERVVVRDPESIGLVASPRRLMVPAGSRRLVRLVNLEGHGDEERVYRVNVRPVAGEMEAGAMGVHILVGYQLLVFVPPVEPRVELDARREGNRLHLHNRGNVNIRLFRGRQCDPPGDTDADCVSVESIRLYPGNEHSVELPRDAPVDYRMQADGSTRNRTFD